MTEQRGSAPVFPVILIGLLWGMNWPAVKFMLTEIPPLTLRGTAFPLAALSLALIVWWRGERLLPAGKDILPIIWTGLMIVFGFNVFTVIGQTLTETSKAAIIAFTMPAFTAGFAVLFLGDRLGGRTILALFLGMSGLAVLASEDIPGLIADARGPLVMLAAAISWALGNIALKARQWSLAPLPLTVWFFIVSAIALWPFILAAEPPWHQSWPTFPVIATMGFHVLGPMVTCYVIWTTLIGRLPATIAAIASLMTPVVGVVSSILLLGDSPTWQKFAALILIVASIALTQIRPRSQHR
jgi:drug/metabolite transporter (DMT)-like permease